MGQELGILLEIAKTQPQSAYSFFCYRIQGIIKTTSTSRPSDPNRLQITQSLEE